MTDNLVQLLPDAIANQIAAGEVIQRPASVVKELLENAIDSGASEIELTVKDSGKTLIQVRDNGCGMSETDARMSLERHATSKLRSADDLFNLRTMGFRGEALASIAAVAQMEIKTRRAPDELGTRLVVEGSEVTTQEPAAAEPGTTMSVRNLFFNIPARRNFLKSDSVELRHIRDEFNRVALAYPRVRFDLIINDRLDLALPGGILRQRIVQIFGRRYEKRLVPVEEDTDVIQITGFIGTPDAARKTKTGQYFFVNDRFIKDSYLHHAVVSGYDDLLKKDSYPFYVINLRIDPARIDVNVHPTKQEIKFEDGRTVYNYLKATVRHGLGRASITPALDFIRPEPAFQTGPAPAGTYETEPQADALPSKMNSDYLERVAQRSSSGSPSNYSPGEAETSTSESQRQANNLRHWERLYAGLGKEDSDAAASPDLDATSEFTAALVDLGTGEVLQSKVSDDVLPSRVSAPETGEALVESDRQIYQLHARYIVSPVKSGWLLIDQRAAHRRVLYEAFLQKLEASPASSQQSLFPQTLDLPHADAALLRDLLPGLKKLGFDVEAFGGDSFILRGVPAEIAGRQNEKEIIENLLQQYHDDLDMANKGHERLARALANGSAIKKGQPMSAPEMLGLINQLFACEQPQLSPSGDRTFIKYELSEVERLFLT